MFQPKAPTPVLLAFVERYMAVGNPVLGVRIGELDGRETLEAEVSDLNAVDLPDSFQGVPVVVRKLTTAEPPPEIRAVIDLLGPHASAEDARPGPLSQFFPTEASDSGSPVE
jgi:hypothetical protein